MNLKSLTKAGLVMGILAAMVSTQAQVVSGANTGSVTAGTTRSVTFDYTAASGNVASVSLDVGMTAGVNLSGMSATLISPGGAQSRAVFSQQGGAGNSATLTFVDSGSSTWTGQSSGTFQPNAAFGNFGGVAINGTWTLDVSSAGPSGNINSAQLTLTAVPEPTAFAAAFGLMAMGVGAYRRMKKA
jgi:hypothetical protein